MKDFDRNTNDSAKMYKPKFNIYDIISDGNVTYEVSTIDIYFNEYMLTTVDGKCKTVSCEKIDSTFHLWNIYDAKDGDVMMTQNYTFLFKAIDKNDDVKYYCAYELNHFKEFDDDDPFHIACDASVMGNAAKKYTYYRPAFKDDRDRFFKILKESGYVWDDKNKELKNAAMLNMSRKFNVGDHIYDKNTYEEYVVDNVCSDGTYEAKNDNIAVKFSDDSDFELCTYDYDMNGNMMTKCPVNKNDKDCLFNVAAEYALDNIHDDDFDDALEKKIASAFVYGAKHQKTKTIKDACKCFCKVTCMGYKECNKCYYDGGCATLTEFKKMLEKC